MLKKKHFLWVVIIFLILLSLVGIVMFFQSRKKEPKPLGKIIIQPTEKHSATVICLHGLGDRAETWQNNFQPIVNKYPHIKFIFPQAPAIPVSMNWGVSMPAWYNIRGNPRRDIMKLKEDKVGLMNSVKQINQIIQSEISSGVPAKRIIVMGHSQGASVALAVGLTSDYQLAGIIGLSGFLPCRNEIFKEAKENSKQTPFFLYHNYYDNVVPADIGSQSAKLLKEKGYQVEFDGDYSGTHFFQSEELQEIITGKLNKLLPPC